MASTSDGPPLECGKPTATIEQIEAWNNRDRKLFIISIGQSNNGLENEPAGSFDETLDAPDPTIFELSQGIGYVDPDEDTGTGVVNVNDRPWVAESGELHVFEHPAQDDRGGICMRLSGAKYLKQLYPNVTEIAMYCGGEGGSSLRRQWDVGPVASAEGRAQRTDRAIAFCDAFMRANPDYTPVFWCSLGFTDALELMPPAEYQTRLTTLAQVLRESIYGADRAFWVQADMPQAAIDNFDANKAGTPLADIAALQKTVNTFIPLSSPATMSDLSIYDSVHLDAASLRTLGERMAIATAF